MLCSNMIPDFISTNFQSLSFLSYSSARFFTLLCAYILAKRILSDDPLLLLGGSILRILTRTTTTEQDSFEADFARDYPPIISSNSHYVNVNGKQLRTVHIIHELGSEVPLMVFIHGLGGQAAQWDYQIEYFSQTANVLAVDLLGCGKSEVVKDWSAYTTQSLVNDLATILLTRYRSSYTIIIGHSYGCTLAIILAATQSLHLDVGALVLLNPKAHVDLTMTKSQRYIRYVPDALIDYMRRMDRRGGPYSKSVNRMVASECSKELRMKQLKWNMTSRTPVWKRMIAGMDWIRKEATETIKCPVLQISGKEDNVCSPYDTHIIRAWLLHLDPPPPSSPPPSQPSTPLQSESGISLEISSALATTSSIPVNEQSTQRVPVPYIIPAAGHSTMMEKPELVDPIITQFLIKNCKLGTMDPAWQTMQKLAGENKWSLKNLEKWKRTPIVSISTIGPSLFRAMKVMRQTDPDHSPSAFQAAHPEIGFIIDISHEVPPYRTSDFDGSSIEYIKLSTVSKIPPKREDVRTFVETAKNCWKKCPDKQVAVHCHYGYNRTGFAICCYLIEELGISVRDAINFFAEARPPGIKHSYFKDELYLRYELPDRNRSRT